MSVRALPLLVVAALAMPVTALAAPADPPSEEAEQARAHFRAGSAFYANGMYDKAIAEFETAWELAPMPDILFNLGQAHRLGGDRRAAIRSYKKFLSTAPRGPAAVESRHHVQALEDELAREEREQKERLEREQRDRERAEQERVQKERLERQEKERLERVRLEGERLRVEGERLGVERERLEKERLEKERALAAVRAVPPPAPPVPLFKRWWPWTLAGFAVATGVGVGLGAGLAPGPQAPEQATDLGTHRPF